MREADDGLPPIAAPERENPGIRRDSPARRRRRTLAGTRPGGQFAVVVLRRPAARRRSASAPKSRRPLSMKKNDADCGEAKRPRSACSSVRPSTPAGIVPMTRSQPSLRPSPPDRCRGSPAGRESRDDPLPVVPGSQQAMASPGALRRERQEVWSFWWMSQPRGSGNDAMPEVRDREELGDASKSPRTMAWK